MLNIMSIIITVIVIISVSNRRFSHHLDVNVTMAASS